MAPLEGNKWTLGRETVSEDCQPKNGQPGSPLGLSRRGFSGRIKSIDVGTAAYGVTAIELEQRLLELGFLEGAAIEVVHEGPLGRDPIAVRLNGTLIALRRREAMAVIVT